MTELYYCIERNDSLLKPQQGIGFKYHLWSVGGVLTVRTNPKHSVSQKELTAENDIINSKWKRFYYSPQGRGPHFILV